MSHKRPYNSGNSSKPTQHTTNHKSAATPHAQTPAHAAKPSTHSTSHPNSSTVPTHHASSSTTPTTTTTTAATGTNPVTQAPPSSSSTTTTTTATTATTAAVGSSNNGTLPFGAYANWAAYRTHMLTIMDLEYGLQTQLSPKNAFTVDWSVSQHLLTEQMNLIATIVIPYTNNYLPVDNLKLGDRLQFLHPTAPQFNIHNLIPITGFIDNIIPENDAQQYSIDVIIDTIPTTFLRDPSLTLPTLSQINAGGPSASPLSSPLHATLLQQPLSQEQFLKVFVSIDFPPAGYQIVLHNSNTLNYHRIYYNLHTMKLPQHLENCIIGQYSPIANPLEAIGFRPEAIPSKHDIVRKDVIHATTTIPSIFDQQQVDTLHYAIQQPFCVIRAPPGCGKTEMISTAGLKIQAILKRQYVAHQLEEEDYTPVLVTGANEVSLFNEVGKYIFTRSDEVLVISNTFSTKWLHDPVLRPTLLQSVIATWIYEHPDDLLNNFMQRIFPGYPAYTQRQRYILALKLHLIINDDRFMLNLAMPGLENHYIDPNTNAGETGFQSTVSPIPDHTVPGVAITPSRLVTNHSTNHIVDFDTIKPILLFNPYHFFERLSLLFLQDENDHFDDDQNDEDDDEEEDKEADENTFNPDITPLSLQDTLLFCEHYHELQLYLIRNSNIVCCANELAGNKLLFHSLKFHHVLMDDTHSIIEPITLLPLNYGAKQALMSYDNALLRPPTPFTPGPKQHRFSRPLAERLLTLNDWQNLKPLPANASNIQTVRIVPSAHCNVQYRVHPKLFEFPYLHHYKTTYPNLLNQLTLPRDVHARNYDVLFASVYKRDIADKHSDCPRVFGPKYFDWAVRRLEADRAGMYNRSLEKFPWPNEQLPFLFLSTTNPQFEAQLKQKGIVNNTTNPLEAQYADCLLAHFVHLGLNLDDLGIIVPFQDQIEAMFHAFATPKSALTQALYERRLLQKNDTKTNLQLYFRTKLKIALPDHFQSVDCKILIFSTTRTQAKALGPILANPSVINLAMTRARNAVMFLGDHHTLLEHSVAWTKLILYAADNNALMLPTMAKRFVPWLATSRVFIYEMNRRKKEMILHQFLPQLLAQSVSSPPTSKDPVESKAFKQQLVEFEECDTLLQYYRQLLSDWNATAVNRTNELDLYDDGFTQQQNASNFYALTSDDTIHSNSAKSQSQGLSLHFAFTVSKLTPIPTQSPATAVATVIASPESQQKAAAAAKTMSTTTTTRAAVIVAKPVTATAAVSEPPKPTPHPETTPLSTVAVVSASSLPTSPSSVPLATSQSPPAVSAVSVPLVAAHSSTTTRSTQAAPNGSPSVSHQHQQPQQHHHSHPSHHSTTLSSHPSYGSASSSSDEVITMIPGLNPIALLSPGEPLMSNMGSDPMLGLGMHPQAGLGSPLGTMPSHSGLMSPPGFPLPSVGTSPIAPHQLTLSSSALSSTHPISPPTSHTSLHAPQHSQQSSQSLHHHHHHHHHQQQQHLQAQQHHQAQQQGFASSPVATSPNLFVGHNGLDFQNFHAMVYPPMHHADASSPHLGGAQDDQSDLMGPPGNIFMDPQLGGYSFLIPGMYPQQQPAQPQPSQQHQSTQSQQNTQQQPLQPGQGSAQMSAMMNPGTPIPVNLGVGQNSAPFFSMPPPNGLIPAQNQMNPQMAAMAAQMNFGGMFPPNQMMPPPPGNPLMAQPFNNQLYQQNQFMPPGMAPMPGMQPGGGMMNNTMGLISPPPPGPNNNNNFNPAQNQPFFGGQPGMQLYPPGAQFGFPGQGMMGQNGFVGMPPPPGAHGGNETFTLPNPAPVSSSAQPPPPPTGN